VSRAGIIQPSGFRNLRRASRIETMLFPKSGLRAADIRHDSIDLLGKIDVGRQRLYELDAARKPLSAANLPRQMNQRHRFDRVNLRSAGATRKKRHDFQVRRQCPNTTAPGRTLARSARS